MVSIKLVKRQPQPEPASPAPPASPSSTSSHSSSSSSSSPTPPRLALVELNSLHDLDGAAPDLATLRYFKSAAEFYSDLYETGVKQRARDKALEIINSSFPPESQKTPGTMQIEVSSDRVSHISFLRFVLLAWSPPRRFCLHHNGYSWTWIRVPSFSFSYLLSGGWIGFMVYR